MQASLLKVLTVAQTATLPGLIECCVASRTAPRVSITPGTSLPGKTSIDSMGRLRSPASR